MLELWNEGDETRGKINYQINNLISTNVVNKMKSYIVFINDFIPLNIQFQLIL